VKLADLIPTSAIRVPLRATDVDGALVEMAEALARAHGFDAGRTREELRRREQLGSTAVGDGIALPHARSDVPATVGALGIVPQGIDWDAPDGARVHLVVALLSPSEGAEHLAALATVGRELGNASLRADLCAAANARHVHALLANRE
jgi:mannitol/fructose-specific phosphotransferase system IIA component (Ntr-type)